MVIGGIILIITGIWIVTQSGGDANPWPGAVLAMIGVVMVIVAIFAAHANGVC
jgi:peptidoglycan/LPS O-acetylase OafA/YrhL